MNDRKERPLFIDLMAAVLAPFFFILPVWSATAPPPERRRVIRVALLLGAVLWISLLWWALA